MTMASLLVEYIAEPLGASWPDLILIFFLCLSIIFFAIGLRSGLILLWALLGMLYVVYYQTGTDTLHVFTLFIGVGVIMIVSMLVSHSHEKSGVYGI